LIALAVTPSSWVGTAAPLAVASPTVAKAATTPAPTTARTLRDRSLVTFISPLDVVFFD
jgi:hypothetical protein